MKRGKDWYKSAGKELVVLGAGESGVGAAILGIKQGYRVLVSDNGAITEQVKEVLKNIGAQWEENGHSFDRILDADLVVKSPGIPDRVKLIQELHKREIPIISEIEFASAFTTAKLIAITGSNGKTTTTMLTHHLLNQGGYHVGMAGNIGDSFARMVAEQDYDYYVLEVSSFQLDGIVHFKPHVAVITNISPDHLDRYDYKMEKYIASKMRITENQGPQDHLIFDADDAILSEEICPDLVQAHLWPFSLSKALEQGACLIRDIIKISTEKNTFEMTVNTLALDGMHNVKNTMAAALASRLVGLRKEAIRESVTNFQGAPHRLEKVLKIHHVQYINDSKATNVNATYYALDSMTTPVVWIVGGVDKGNDYTSLMPLVREKVKAIICLGLDNSKLKDVFGQAADIFVETYAMSEAVKVAYKIADRGDSVLLSPACASFDLFDNYEHRGDQFKEAVKNL